MRVLKILACIILTCLLFQTNLGQNEGGFKPYTVCYYVSSICYTLHIQTSPLFFFG